MIATSPGSDSNPFHLYMLPLAYEHSNLLQALLGFAASHISPSEFPQQATAAIEHRLLALQALSSLLIKEQCLGLTDIEEDITLSLVLLLLLQDVSVPALSNTVHTKPSRYANLEFPLMELTSTALRFYAPE